MDTRSRADADRLVFIKSQLTFWIMAATDGHAKNFWIFLERGGAFHMTPLQDVLSIWSVIGNGARRISPRHARLAMAQCSKNAYHHQHKISTRHWQAQARQNGVPEAFEHTVALVQQVPEAL
nr:HipA domain-containing protein [Polaromonas sp. CG_9.11]